MSFVAKSVVEKAVAEAVCAALEAEHSGSFAPSPATCSVSLCAPHGDEAVGAAVILPADSTVADSDAPVPECPSSTGAGHVYEHTHAEEEVAPAGGESDHNSAEVGADHHLVVNVYAGADRAIEGQEATLLGEEGKADGQADEGEAGSSADLPDLAAAVAPAVAPCKYSASLMPSTIPLSASADMYTSALGSCDAVAVVHAASRLPRDMLRVVIPFSERQANVNVSAPHGGSRPAVDTSRITFGSHHTLLTAGGALATAGGQQRIHNKCKDAGRHPILYMAQSFLLRQRMRGASSPSSSSSSSSAAPTCTLSSSSAAAYDVDSEALGLMTAIRALADRGVTLRGGDGGAEGEGEDGAVGLGKEEADRSEAAEAVVGLPPRHSFPPCVDSLSGHTLLHALITPRPSAAAPEKRLNGHTHSAAATTVTATTQSWDEGAFDEGPWPGGGAVLGGGAAAVLRWLLRHIDAVELRSGGRSYRKDGGGDEAANGGPQTVANTHDAPLASLQLSFNPNKDPNESRSAHRYEPQRVGTAFSPAPVVVGGSSGGSRLASATTVRSARSLFSADYSTFAADSAPLSEGLLLEERSHHTLEKFLFSSFHAAQPPLAACAQVPASAKKQQQLQHSGAKHRSAAAAVHVAAAPPPTPIEWAAARGDQPALEVLMAAMVAVVASRSQRGEGARGEGANETEEVGTSPFPPALAIINRYNLLHRAAEGVGSVAVARYLLSAAVGPHLSAAVVGHRTLVGVRGVGFGGEAEAKGATVVGSGGGESPSLNDRRDIHHLYSTSMCTAVRDGPSLAAAPAAAAAGMSPFHLACANGHANLVAFFIEEIRARNAHCDYEEDNVSDNNDDVDGTFGATGGVDMCESTAGGGDWGKDGVGVVAGSSAHQNGITASSIVPFPKRRPHSSSNAAVSASVSCLLAARRLRRSVCAHTAAVLEGLVLERDAMGRTALHCAAEGRARGGGGASVGEVGGVGATAAGAQPRAASSSVLLPPLVRSPYAAHSSSPIRSAVVGVFDGNTSNARSAASGTRFGTADAPTRSSSIAAATAAAEDPFHRPPSQHPTNSVAPSPQSVGLFNPNALPPPQPRMSRSPVTIATVGGAALSGGDFSSSLRARVDATAPLPSVLRPAVFAAGGVVPSTAATAATDSTCMIATASLTEEEKRPSAAAAAAAVDSSEPPSPLGSASAASAAVAILRMLIAIAPSAIDAVDSMGRTPLELALRRSALNEASSYTNSKGNSERAHMPMGRYISPSTALAVHTTAPTNGHRISSSAATPTGAVPLVSASTVLTMPMSAATSRHLTSPAAAALPQHTANSASSEGYSHAIGKHIMHSMYSTPAAGGAYSLHGDSLRFGDLTAAGSGRRHGAPLPSPLSPSAIGGAAVGGISSSPSSSFSSPPSLSPLAYPFAAEFAAARAASAACPASASALFLLSVVRAGGLAGAAEARREAVEFYSMSVSHLRPEEWGRPAPRVWRGK